MKKYLSLFLFLVVFLFVTVVVLVVCFVIILILTESSLSSKSTVPKFDESPFELVMSDSFEKAHLYYQTNKQIVTGDKLEELDFIIVSKISMTEVFDKAEEGKKTYNIKHLDRYVDDVGPGYVLFKFDYDNFDCFAAYENKKVIPVKHVRIMRLPLPSDSWMCQGYDFKEYPNPDLN